MKSNKRATPQEDEPVLEVASLIDVCFLLLIYFLATSTIVPMESDLDMRLPTGGVPADRIQFEPLLIQISATGEIFAGSMNNSQMMDSDLSMRELPLLRQYLDMYVGASNAANTIPLVRIMADGEVSHQRVIDVLNALAKAKIRSVTFDDLEPVS